jgi:hypothetical protein
MFDEELSELTKLPEGLDEMAPGSGLGALLEALARRGCRGTT